MDSNVNMSVFLITALPLCDQHHQIYALIKIFDSSFESLLTLRKPHSTWEFFESLGLLRYFRVFLLPLCLLQCSDLCLSLYPAFKFFEFCPASRVPSHVRVLEDFRRFFSAMPKDAIPISFERVPIPPRKRPI